MIQNFTGAYRLVDVNIQEHGGDRVILPNDLYNELHLGYDPSIPLLMKFEESYFPVYGETAVPFDTLAFPKSQDFIEDIEYGADSVWAVKPEYVKALFPDV